MKIFEYNGQDQVHISNDKGLRVKYVGYSYVKSPFDSQISLSLQNLLHVPRITKNLISVPKFANDNQVFFEFHPSHCYVKMQNTNKIVLEGKTDQDGLYQFNNFQLQHLANPAASLSNFATNNSRKISHLVQAQPS